MAVCLGNAKLALQQTPCMLFAQIWQEYENLTAVPLQSGDSYTAAHRLLDIPIAPKLHLLGEVCRHLAENRGLLPITILSGAPLVLNCGKKDLCN